MYPKLLLWLNSYLLTLLCVDLAGLLGMLKSFPHTKISTKAVPGLRFNPGAGYSSICTYPIAVHITPTIDGTD